MIKKRSRRSTQPDYTLIEKRREIDDDIKQRIARDFIEQYQILDIKKFIDNLQGKSWWEHIFTPGETKNLLEKNEFMKSLPKILKDPSGYLGNLDILRGIYFHNSEKGKMKKN